MERITLEGYGVRLEPLAEKHLPRLREDCHDPALWEFTYQPDPFGSDETARAWIEAGTGDGIVTFAVIDTVFGRFAGTTRYFDVDERHRKLEIGWTALARAVWQTHVNTASKMLLLRYAFERWNANRVQFKAEAKNRRSRRAIERIGATFEGTLRHYRIRPDGEIRDTSFYSVIRPEWPSVERHLTELLTRYERVANA